MAILISNYKREIEREDRTGHISTWRWRTPLKRLVEKLQKPGENDETDTESETEDETSKIDKLNLVSKFLYRQNGLLRLWGLCFQQKKCLLY